MRSPATRQPTSAPIAQLGRAVSVRPPLDRTPLRFFGCAHLRCSRFQMIILFSFLRSPFPRSSSPSTALTSTMLQPQLLAGSLHDPCCLVPCHCIRPVSPGGIISLVRYLPAVHFSLSLLALLCFVSVVCGSVPPAPFFGFFVGSMVSSPAPFLSSSAAWFRPLPHSC